MVILGVLPPEDAKGEEAVTLVTPPTIELLAHINPTEDFVSICPTVPILPPTSCISAGIIFGGADDRLAGYRGWCDGFDLGR